MTAAISWKEPNEISYYFRMPPVHVKDTTPPLSLRHACLGLYLTSPLAYKKGKTQGAMLGEDSKPVVETTEWDIVAYMEQWRDLSFVACLRTELWYWRCKKSPVTACPCQCLMILVHRYLTHLWWSACLKSVYFASSQLSVDGQRTLWDTFLVADGNYVLFSPQKMRWKPECATQHRF